MPFLTQLQIDSVRGTEYYKLRKPLVYFSNKRDAYYVAPAGMLTNFASTPRLVKWYIDNDGPVIRDISVLHDYFYSCTSTKVYISITRRKADILLREGMLDLGARLAQAWVVYFILRLCGWLNYKKDVKVGDGC